MNSKANTEFTLFLNTEYRITMGLELENESIRLMNSFESDEKVFNEVTQDIRDNAAKHGPAFIGYKRYPGKDGMMVFVDYKKALAAYQQELINRGYEGSKITSIVITDRVKKTGMTTDFDSYPPATTRIDENGLVYENYPAVLKLP